MAYIDASTVAKIRAALKSEIPEAKFSVRKKDNLAVGVSIIKSPYFDDGEDVRVNNYHIDRNYEGKQAEVLNKVDNIIRSAGDYYDDSDIMTDYFNVAFYYSIHIGGNKPHVKV